MSPLLRLQAPLALSLAVLPACGSRTSHVSVPVPSGPPVYVEREPNDSPAFPDYIGPVNNHTLLYVEGHVEAIGFDVVDHIEFLSVEPAAYDFHLQALSPFGDVDVTIYDPIDNLVVAEYFFTGPVEFGRVVVHQPNRPFQFIIEAYGVDTEWELELVGAPYTGFRVPAAQGDPLDLDAADGSGEESVSLPAIEALGALRPRDTKIVD